MLPAEENKILTETGPATPMGNLFRRYWIPALTSEDLPSPDCPPVRVKLLGENLLAFRDSGNRIGLFDEHCPHRRASMFFGRNEECGLRCVYHGWKFDVSGQCVDMPSEPAESNFKDKVTIKSYPCREAGGVVWAYMGPPGHQPAELPPFPFLSLPKGQRRVLRYVNEANYFQGIESAIDSSHISFLHRSKAPTNPKMSRVTHRFGNPKFEVVKTDYGMLVGARRATDDPKTFYWRITQYIMPWYQMIPPIALETTPVDMLNMTSWIPIDDHTSMNWVFTWDPLYDLNGPQSRIPFSPPEVIPGTWMPKVNKSNDYLIDRKLQASGDSFTGIPNIPAQDQAMTESQGFIADRTKERLGTSDTAIIIGRRILINAAIDLQKGETPPGLDPGKMRVRPVSILLEEGVPFQEGAKEFLTISG